MRRYLHYAVNLAAENHTHIHHTYTPPIMYAIMYRLQQQSTEQTCTASCTYMVYPRERRPPHSPPGPLLIYIYIHFPLSDLKLTKMHLVSIVIPTQPRSVFMSKDFKLMQGDCLWRMKEIESGSVDMVLTDINC